MRRTVPFVTLALALIATLLPTSPAAAAPAPAPAPAPGARAVAWEPCPQDPAVECGTLAVPIDWDRPHGPTIDLALARRKATDPAARIGSLVINPGGPGGSGVDFAFVAHGYFSPEIARRFDIVGFDPRGVARSNPILCSADFEHQLPPVILKSQADYDAWIAYNERLRADCRSHTGPLFDHVDTLSVVRDLDAIRAALGEAKLSYYGASYGTLIGQQYAELFPRRVRALALDSNMDHSVGTAAFVETQAAAVQDSFDEFVSWCERDPSCALNGRDVRAFWRDLLVRADRGEVHPPAQPELDVTSLDLVTVAFGHFYGPNWPQLATTLAGLIIDTAPATPAAKAAPAPGEAATPDIPELLATGAGAAPAPRAVPGNAELVNLPVEIFCQDYDLPIRDYREYASLLRRSERAAPDMLYSANVVGLVPSCLGHPRPIPNPQDELRVRGSAPLLLGNALHDPATGYNWATSTARQLGRQAVLLTYEGWGHGIYPRGACTIRAFDDYLISGTLPAKGTRCPAAPAPEATAKRAPLLPRTGPLPNVPGWTP
ncbi:peptidase [Microtetraspora sp. NBRC 13810]|uniref:alpha/beta hydrolase n=1 Tax=Microtetraspora sp. NBRC 13810 TaxID=3030990 RepID=UPI0024A0EE49|nr:alpha/beta hydrolase [Microtetraspora sp. NBRC 13810]GLW05293.1 peptidase [Microtetraspora sp. NBRC 13810]